LPSRQRSLVNVGQQFVEQIAAARVIPEMMVLDNGQIGLEDFLRELAKPLGIRQRAGIGAGYDGYGVLSGGLVRQRRLSAAPFGKSTLKL